MPPDLAAAVHGSTQRCVCVYRKRKLTGADGSCRELSWAPVRSRELLWPPVSSRQLLAAPVSSCQLSLFVHTYTQLCTAMDSGCQIRRQSFLIFLFFNFFLVFLTSIPAKTYNFQLVLQQKLKTLSRNDLQQLHKKTILAVFLYSFHESDLHFLTSVWAKTIQKHSEYYFFNATVGGRFWSVFLTFVVKPIGNLLFLLDLMLKIKKKSKTQ